uniref:Uncharacterized protein n=1 Tax=Ananas comosus var. bracteatus TaxID=296719 RepID=A0A6V7PLJ6_ANACO|nr:unnamed protein product [Ananas comosus var. bracteatus]
MIGRGAADLRPRRRRAVTATLCSGEGPRQGPGIDGAAAFEVERRGIRGNSSGSIHQSRRRRAGVDGSAEITSRVMGGGSAWASTNWPRVARLRVDRPQVARLREDRPRVARLRVTATSTEPLRGFGRIGRGWRGFESRTAAGLRATEGGELDGAAERKGLARPARR